MNAPVLTIAQTTPDLPPTAHLLIAGALLGGVILWAFGQRLLRPTFAFLGGIAGALSGFFAAPLALPPEVFGYPSPHIGAGIGALLGLASALLLYRFAVAGAMAACGGLAGILIAGSLISGGAVSQAAASARSSLVVSAPMAQLSVLPPLDPAGIREAARPITERVTAFIHQKRAELSEIWAGIPERDQARLLVAALSGLAGGCLLGVVAPRRSAAACTAAFGAAVWIPSAVWLLQAMEPPAAHLLEHPPWVWLAFWTLMVLLGFVLQVIGRRKKVPTDD